MMTEPEGSRTSPGDVEQIAEEGSRSSRSHGRQLVKRFDGSELGGSDFAGVAAPGGKFEASMLRGSDFSHADLTGSSFKKSAVADTNFDDANLTDANLSTVDLAHASFCGSIL